MFAIYYCTFEIGIYFTSHPAHGTAYWFEHEVSKLEFLGSNLKMGKEGFGKQMGVGDLMLYIAHTKIKQKEKNKKMECVSFKSLPPNYHSQLKLMLIFY